MKRSHQVKEGRVSEVRFSWGYQATDRESVDWMIGVYGMGDDDQVEISDGDCLSKHRLSCDLFNHRSYLTTDRCEHPFDASLEGNLSETQFEVRVFRVLCFVFILTQGDSETQPCTRLILSTLSKCSTRY